MATKIYESLQAFYDAAEALHATIGVPLDPPRNDGEMFLADGLAIYLELQDSEEQRHLALNGSLEPAQLERAIYYVRSTIAQAQTFTEHHLAQALAARGRGYNVVRAGQQWLMRHGDETERKVYGAIWATDSIDQSASRQRELFEDEALWLDTAYTATGHEPPVHTERSWQAVMDTTQEVQGLRVQERPEAELADYSPDSDPEVIASRAQDPSLNVEAHETDREQFEREYERRQQGTEADWTVTPAQAIAAWVRTTTHLDTLISTGNLVAARENVREGDAYLKMFDLGEVPPGDYEEDGYFLQALERAAVPIDSPVPERVLEQLRDFGATLPDFPDATDAARVTGVRGLDHYQVRQILTEPGNPATPDTAPGRAFTATWEDATGDLDVALNVAYDRPGAPGQVLLERLGGENVDAYVNVMFPADGALEMTDVLGDQLSDDVLTERLNLSDEQAATITDALRDSAAAAARANTGNEEPVAATRITDPDIAIHTSSSATGTVEEHLAAARQTFTELWSSAATAAGLADEIDTVVFDPSDLDHPIFLTDDVAAGDHPGENTLGYTTWDAAGAVPLSRAGAAEAIGVNEHYLELLEPQLVEALRATAPHRAAALNARAADLQPTGPAAAAETAAGAMDPEQSLLKELAAARLSVRRGIAELDEDRPEVAAHLHYADRALSIAIEELRPLEPGELRNARTC